MKKIKALIWKEWREARLFFIAALLLICILRIFCGMFLTSYMKQDTFMLFANIAFPVFASMIATLQVCREFEKDTRLFLISCPVSSLTVLAVKFMTGLVLMFIIVYAAQVAFQSGVLYGLDRQYFTFFNIFLKVKVFVLITLYSSLFFTSLIIRKTLSSIFIAPVITLLLCLINFMPFVLIFMASSNYITAITFSFILILTIYISSIIYVWERNIAKSTSIWKVLPRIGIFWGFIGLSGTVIYAYIYFSTSSELNKTIEDAKKAGILLELSELNGPDIPDKENAALIYKQGFTLAEKLYDVFLKKDKTKEEIVKLFRTHKVELDKLFAIIDKAAKYPECKFNLPYNYVWSNDGPDLYISYMYRLNNLRIKYAFENGNKNEAIKAVYSGFALAHSLDRSLNTFSAWSRLYRIKKIFDIIFEFDISIPAEDYIKWIHEIETTDNELNHIIIVDFSDTFYRRIQELSDITNTTDYESWNIVERFFYNCHLATPVIPRNEINFLRIKMQRMKYINEPFWKVKDKLIYTEHNVKLVQYSSLWQIHKNYIYFKAYFLAKTEVYKTLFAIDVYKSLHGKYPAKLSALVPEIISEVPIDPYSGKQLVYKIDKNAFILYSLGSKMKDYFYLDNIRVQNDIVVMRLIKRR